MSTTGNDADLRPAETLLGKILGDWKVEEKLAIKADATGGCFSVQYRVVNEKRDEAFLKAIDLFRTPGALAELEAGIRNYRYEADILQLCQERTMDGVVRAIDNGIFLCRVGPLELPVPYLIFEKAEADIRTHDRAKTFDLGWRLRVFHGVCVAMSQLHRAGIAHQDMKPSNVLVFDGIKAKVADLGRATMRDRPSSFELEAHVGDRNYWPLELLYRDNTSTNWLQRRLGADFFMMGCVLTFLLTDSSLLTLLFERLDQQFWPQYWGGSYEQVLPHLISALHQVMSEIRETLPASMRQELCTTIFQFTNPEPTKRGRPHIWGDNYSSFSLEDSLQRIAQQYDLERTISRMDDLAKRAWTDRPLITNSFNRRGFFNFLKGQ